MPRGLVIRFVALLAGIVPLVIFLQVVNPPPNLAAAAVIAYAAAVGVGIADYGVKHPDEIPPRKTRR
jgi:hypothetical protein